MRNYESLYSGFVHPKPKTNWSDENDVKKTLEFVDLTGERNLDAGGMPVISDGKTAYVDTSDSHCIVFGPSGFKKSICVFMPAIDMSARAGENFVVTDPKGELYRRTANYVKSRGYRIIVVNFRDYNGDGYNPLSHPARLYKKGEVDKATAISSNLVTALAQRQMESSKIDPFWPETAKAFDNGILPFMYSSYPDPDTVNFISLADYYTNRTVGSLTEYVNDETDVVNAAMQNLRTVLSEPDKTLMSTLSTCSSFIQPFIQNDKLARMLSHSTFDLEEMTNPKTALYIITDDSSPVCDPIVSVLLYQLQATLTDKAYHSENGKLKTRVNFLLDEFCSFPIPDIELALATHRSRNIRYYLCIQSLDLLSKRYPNYKNMMTNCATTLFLGSTEQELLEMISKRCGTTEITMSGHEEPLISVPELMTLRKDWYSKEAVYLNLSSGLRFCTNLPSIEKYEAFCGFGDADIPDVSHPPVCFYSFFDLMRDVALNKTNKPFCKPVKPKPLPFHKQNDCKRKEREESILKEEIQKQLEAKFDELFGAIEGEEDD